jgi:alginate O-acetyltransferase complex protein AlgI
VFFRAETLAGALGYLAAMAGLPAAGTTPVRPVYYLTLEVQIALAVGIVLATRPFQSRLARYAPPVPAAALRAPAAVLQMAVLALALLYVAAGTYNPFIYFRF